MRVDETIAFLRDRPYYADQVRARRTVPGRAATTRSVGLERRLADALADRGIDDLYEHQADAVEAIREGNDVVLATPTASGKSLAYTVPAFERAMERGATTLYIGPQRALINDQEETLSDIAEGLGFGSNVAVRQYTGRLNRAEKRDVRDRRPTVLLTTPDMLHYGILPHAHRLWEWFVSNLELVVVDEVHEYRGVFGSHVSLVLRRLNRMCERFDADPQYVCCSATIGNPVDHAATVVGHSPDRFALIDEDHSATGPTHWTLWNPPEYDGDDRWGGSGRRRSSHTESQRLFVDLVQEGHQTVVFTNSRQTAERYATASADELRERGHTALADGIAAYQAALTRERRAEIEAGLKSGDVRGVWSTNALELGVDIGGLDAVVLDGYPGTRMAARQQAGRAGRGTDPSLVVVVAGEDQLDQYVMSHPEDFFEGNPERAVTNPENRDLLPGHVLSAARENWLEPADRTHFGDGFPDLVSTLTDAGELEGRDTTHGRRWTYDGDGSPQHDMSLRTADDREVKLLADGDTVASLPFDDALRDAHPGAIYHHQGRTYEVVDLDLDRRVADLSPTWADYFTRTLHEKEITVEEDLQEKALETRPDVTVRFAEVTMRKQITGFERRDGSTGEPLDREPLDLPETTLRTRGLYYTVPPDVEARLRTAGSGGDSVADDAVTDGGLDGTREFGGAIHAAEHAMIALMPLSVLCDRRDVGGLSTPLHPHTGQATVFVYDGHPGGVGLTREAYGSVVDLMDRTRNLLADCPCEDGCPACVQSPHCGNANEPLEKDLAYDLLDDLLDP